MPTETETLKAQNAALQQRLTAAEQRIDTLQSELTKAREESADNLSDANNASALLQEVSEWFDDGVGRSAEEYKLLKKISNWLNPSAQAVEDPCAHSYGNNLGCPECGEEVKP